MAGHEIGKTMENRKMPKSYLNKIYDINPDTGNYIIEIAVEDYKNIFNELDYGPMIKREIAPDLKNFLYDCSYDIPYRYGIDIFLNIWSMENNKFKEELVLSGFKTYFSFYLRKCQKRLKRSYYQIAEYILISFMLLLSSFFLERKLIKSVLSSVVLEGLIIGGWVFLWQSIAFITGDRKKLTDEIKTLKRLLDSSIYFKYRL